MIYLDTHVALWLYTNGATAVPKRSIALLGQEDDIRISPMVRLEMQYLKEIQRINVEPLTIMDSLGLSIGLSVCNAPFSMVIKEAESNTWTRDPFDRIIVAQASVYDAILITEDETIQDKYPMAVWQ